MMALNQLTRIVLVFATLFLSSQLFADSPTENKRTSQLKSLLEKDAKNQTDQKVIDLLKFYQSGGVDSESFRQGPFWTFISSWMIFEDPVLIAKFLEIPVLKNPVVLSPATKKFIEEDPNKSLSAAIELSQKDFSVPARMAAEVINQYRDKLTADQWKQIIEGRKYVIRHRDKYPAGIHAEARGYNFIPMGYVFISATEGKILMTESKVYFDGKQKYPRGTSGRGWRADNGYIGFGQLPDGPHELQVKTTYDFELDQIKFSGITMSKVIPFEITSKDTPDQLAAEVDEKLMDKVENSVVIGSPDESKEVTYSKSAGNKKFTPQALITIPSVKVTNPLPVALCMKPEIFIEGEEKPLTRIAWIVPAGKTSTRILENSVGDSRLLKLLREQADSEGRLKATLVLKPSRAEALTYPSIKKYYPKPIEREIEFKWSEPASSALNN